MRRVLINIYSYIQYLPNKPLYKWLNALPRPNVENFVFFQGNNLNNQSNQYGGVHPWIAHPKRAFFRFGGVPTPPHTPPRSIPDTLTHTLTHTRRKPSSRVAYPATKNGPRTLPWGTPHRIKSRFDLKPSTVVYCLLSDKYDVRRAWGAPRMP